MKNTILFILNTQAHDKNLSSPDNFRIMHGFYVNNSMILTGEFDGLSFFGTWYSLKGTLAFN